MLKNAVDIFEGFGNGKSGSIYRPVSSKIALYARPIGNSAPKLVYRIAQPVTVGKKLADFDHRKYGAHASNCTFARSPLGPNTRISAYLEHRRSTDCRPQGVPFPDTRFASKKSYFGPFSVTIDNVRETSLPSISFDTTVLIDTGGNNDVAVRVPGARAADFERYSDSKKKTSRNAEPGTRMRLHAANGFSYTYIVPDRYAKVGLTMEIYDFQPGGNSPKRGPLVKLDLAFYRDVAIMTNFAHGTIGLDPQPFDCKVY